MPDLLILLLALIGLLVGIPLLCESGYKFLWSPILGAMLVIWLSVAGAGDWQEHSTISSTEHTAEVANHVPVILVDGETVNLAAKLKRNVAAGTVVVCTVRSKWYGGIWWGVMHNERSTAPHITYEIKKAAQDDTEF